MSLIKNSIIPEQVRGYYILPTTIVGVDIGKTHISATKIYARGRSITVQESVRETLPPGTTADYQERASAVLRSLLERLKPYNEIRTALPSSSIIFKELRLPFLKRNKIELVIEFEVEPLLPFSLDSAVIDFIITKQIPAEQSSELLVAAVQKQYIAQHLSLFQEAGADPTVVTIDLFAVYGMYKRLPNRPTTQTVILLDIGSYTTHIGYINNDQLRFIRSLPQGIVDQTKKISDLTTITNNQVMEYLVRFGLSESDNSDYSKAATTAFNQLLSSIDFTIRSFNTQSENNSPKMIVLLGDGATIKGMPQFIQTTLGITCTVLNIHDLAKDTTIQFANKNHSDVLHAISLATALPSPVTDAFNLRKKEFERASDKALAKQQFLMTLLLSAMIFIIIFAHTFLQTRKLSREVDSAREEVLLLLQERFGSTANEEDLSEAVQAAQRSTQEEEKLLFSFANPARTSFLKYLLELTNRIDKEGLGFTISSLKITEDSITMQAHVKDHAALVFLEKELRQSPLFSYVEGQDTPDFTMKIRLAKNPRRKG